jgi:hypothetical protein
MPFLEPFAQSICDKLESYDLQNCEIHEDCFRYNVRKLHLYFCSQMPDILHQHFCTPHGNCHAVLMLLMLVAREIAKYRARKWIPISKFSDGLGRKGLRDEHGMLGRVSSTRAHMIALKYSSISS